MLGKKCLHEKAAAADHPPSHILECIRGLERGITSGPRTGLPTRVISWASAGVPVSVVVGCSGLTLCGRVFECRGPVRVVPISERSQRRQRPRFPCTQRPPCTERLAPVFRWDITTPRSARSRSGSSLASLYVSSSRSCTPGSATGRAPRAHQPEAGTNHHAASS